MTLWRIWQTLTPEERAAAMRLTQPSVRAVARLCWLRWLARRQGLAQREIPTDGSRRLAFSRYLVTTGRLRED